MLPYLAQPKRSKLRASDLDRHHTVDLLSQATGEGRLTTEELEQRVEQAYHARTLGELAALTADLPVDPRTMPTASHAISAASGDRGRRSASRLLRSIRRAVELDCIAVAIWLLTGHEYFWPRWVIIITAVPVVLRGWRYLDRRWHHRRRRHPIAG